MLRLQRHHAPVTTALERGISAPLLVLGRAGPTLSSAGGAHSPPAGHVTPREPRSGYLSYQPVGPKTLEGGGGRSGRKTRNPSRKKYYSLDSQLTLRYIGLGSHLLEFPSTCYTRPSVLLPPARPYLRSTFHRYRLYPAIPPSGSTIPQSCPRIWSRLRRLTRPLTYVMNPDTGCLFHTRPWTS